MHKSEVLKTSRGRIILMDSITKLTPEDEGAMIVSASHGGSSSGEFALEVPVSVVFFNDAGVGRDNAGISALKMLQDHGVAAGTIAHDSGRIGDSQDMWEHGRISHLNGLAGDLGLRTGESVHDALTRLIQ
ncbi:hypothetical protein SAMN05443999_105247 [Roseovarius azorensis]|uniref:Uncharacterized protein n=1 Tax=Roseovarius azorensis TaxID=1287727 RepID=A0A1H7QE15_9RHOB|nr:hypothetical protein [Roseovarius azorensis]SEL46222.1 hypothetical protein SAMN05443999_105247 [Roseovarius azorensis]